MQIHTAEQIRDLDRFTIENEPISSIDLMERAATKCAERIIDIVDSETPISIFCGKGNNGGDGLALARMLQNEGRAVRLIVVEHSERNSNDFKKNLARLGEIGLNPILLNSISDFPDVSENEILLDAMLGTGLNSPLRGILAEVVTHFNSLPNQVISIDVPTGLFSESNDENDLTKVVQADVTLTFHAPKLSFLLADTAPFAGNWKVLDIGLMEQEQGVASNYRLVDSYQLATLVKDRPKFSHKGTYGHALLMAGSLGKMGAAQLSAKACLRSGAGLLTCQVPRSGLEIMQTGVPEVMCSVDVETNFITQFPKLDGFNAIGIGPGLGTEADTANVLKRLIQEAKAKLVIDADGLNILSENKTWLSFVPRGTVITPHPKEFERLFGATDSAYSRLQLQLEMAQKYHLVIVLKGAHTSVATPVGQVFFNSTGNEGMATAGSGDVLTGVILGLLAQGYSSEVAAVLGVYLHGKAGDLALDNQSTESMIAGDVIENIGGAFEAIKAI